MKRKSKHQSRKIITFDLDDTTTGEDREAREKVETIDSLLRAAQGVAVAIREVQDIGNGAEVFDGPAELLNRGHHVAVDAERHAKQVDCFGHTGRILLGLDQR